MMEDHYSTWRWTSNTLNRTSDQARQTLIRTQMRQVQYKPANLPTMPDPAVPTTLDDAFSTIMKSLSTSSRQCLRYYRSSNSSQRNKQDQRFCERYLNPVGVQRKKFDGCEDLRIITSPGTYSVTASSGSDMHQTHVVHVRHGESASIDFHM